LIFPGQTKPNAIQRLFFHKLSLVLSRRNAFWYRQLTKAKKGSVIHYFKNVPEDLKNELILYTEVATYFLFENSFKIAEHIYDKIIDYSSATTFDEIAELTQSIYRLVEDAGRQGDEQRIEITRSDYNRYVKVAHASHREHKILCSIYPTTLNDLNEHRRGFEEFHGVGASNTLADIYYTFDDLIHLYLNGVLNLHFAAVTDSPSPYHNTKDMSAVLHDIANTTVENFKKAKFDVSWNGHVNSPIELRNLMWYCKSQDRLIKKPRSYPTEVLNLIISQIKNDPSDETYRRLLSEHTGAKKIISHLKTSLLVEAEALKPNKKKTRRKVAKDLINSVFTSLRRKGFIVIDVQVHGSYAYWESENDALDKKMDKMEEEFEGGNRKSLPTRYVTYNRREVTDNEINLSCGFIVKKHDSFIYSKQKVNGEIIKDVEGFVIDEFRKKGFDTGPGARIKNLNKMVDHEIKG